MKRIVFAITLMAAFLLTNCGGGGNIPPDDPTTRDYYKITAGVEGITIDAPTVKKGEDYVGKISVNSGVNEILPDNLKSVILADGVKTDIAAHCEYTIIDDEKKNADFIIPKAYLTNDVEVKLVLKAPRTFEFNQTTSDYKIGPYFTTEGKDYVGKITVKSASNLLPDKLGSVILDDGYQTNITDDCTYTLADNKRSASFVIPKRYTSNKITVDITTHMAATYTVYSEAEGVRFTASTVLETEQYSGLIEIDRNFPKTLPFSLDSVKINGMDVKSECKYEILPNRYNRSARIMVPSKYVIGNINVGLTLLDSPTYTVTTNIPDISISNSIAHENCDFETEISVSAGVLKTLPSNLDWIRRGATDIKKYCYYNCDDEYHATLIISYEAVIGNMEFSLTLEDISHYGLFINSEYVTASPSVVYHKIEYNGTLTLNNQDYILPVALDSVTLASGQSNVDITNYCTYTLNIGSRTASLKIPAQYVTSAIEVELTLISVAEAKWYDYAEWWEYCSNGDSNVQAVEADVGREVNVIINDVTHKVKLIDCDKDITSEGDTVHCTFDFVNVIMADAHNPVATVWNDNTISTRMDNHDYRDSTLNEFLNNEADENSVINMLPEGLRNAIEQVVKFVGVYDSSLSQWAAKGFGGARHKCPKLFPLAYNEIFNDTHEGVVPGEGDIYKYYGSEKKLKHEYQIENYETVWLRSPCSLGYSGAYVIDGAFNLYEPKISNAHYIAPAFCI